MRLMLITACALAGVLFGQAGDCKLLALNPFRKQSQQQDAGQPFGAVSQEQVNALGKERQSGAAGKQDKPNVIDGASIYTNSLWGPNSPLLGQKNPMAMKRYKKAMRRAHHKHFWQRGI